MTVSPFRHLVSDLLAEPGHRRQIDLATEVAWRLELSVVGPAFTADLLLESATGGIVVRGTAATEVTHTCHRCLVQWTEPFEIEVLEVLGMGEDDDGYPLDDDVADLEPPLRDAVLLAIPLAPTCTPGCRGLCAVCGADLNTAPCSGHDEEPDSPFASLRGLLES